jgi:hypothetical protein
VAQGVLLDNSGNSLSNAILDESIDKLQVKVINKEELQDNMWTTVVNSRGSRHKKNVSSPTPSVLTKIRARKSVRGKQKQVQKPSNLNSVTKFNDTTKLTTNDNNLNNNLNNNNTKNKIRHEHQSSFILRSQAHS